MGKKQIQIYMLLALIVGILVIFGVNAMAQIQLSSFLERSEGRYVSINSASAIQLQKVRGIGPVLAIRIVQFREKNGAFRKINDLNQVYGMSEAKMRRIKKQLSL